MFDSAVVQPGGISAEDTARGKTIQHWLPLALAILSTFAFYFSTKPTQVHFDYTYRVAAALLRGHVGLLREPPSWLNEMIPLDGEYYSVFPLGAVLAVVPAVLLRKVWLTKEFPGRFLAALTAGGCVYFFFGLGGIEDMSSLGRRIMLALFPVFGTWTWCNLGFGGAWQIALGFALLGETAALYFTLVRRRPLLAGLFFALAFGNRTELILTLPIFLYFWFCNRAADADGEISDGAITRQHWKNIGRFFAVPALLGLATAAYNFARFHSIFDFGYARIPGVLTEPWYRAGLFSLSAMPWNAYKMLLEGMQSIPQFPYFRPFAFGCSIFISSPFLFLLFRQGGRLRRICWLAIGILTLFLWCHGNPGGWQFSYRYGMILLPWMFLILVGNGPRKISTPELALFIASIAVNAVAVQQFLWVNEIRP